MNHRTLLPLLLALLPACDRSSSSGGDDGGVDSEVATSPQAPKALTSKEFVLPINCLKINSGEVKSTRLDDLLCKASPFSFAASLRYGFSTQLTISYGPYLKALGEPPLSFLPRPELAPTPDFDSYRLLSVAREGGISYAIRVEKRQKSRLLVIKMLDGLTEPGELFSTDVRSVSDADWNKLEELLKEAGYWSMPPLIADDHEVIDGSRHLLEASVSGKYHAVDRVAVSKATLKAAYHHLSEIADLKSRWLALEKELRRRSREDNSQ